MSEERSDEVAGLSVSRETFAALEQFAEFVRRWNPAINLVSKSTVPDLWSRHIVDSAQLFSHCPPDAQLWLDLGSGGGFPGIVVAILAKELQPHLKVALVEADLRKATFLREACRTLSLNAHVHSARIESLPPAQADVLSARALASLPALLTYADQHLNNAGLALFPKGTQYETELSDAQKSYKFDVKLFPSLSEPKAAILEIRNIQRA